MRILFATDRTEAPSTELNAGNYARLDRLPGVSIDFYNRAYEKYDVILFMGYDPDPDNARRINPRARLGIIDPRPGTEHDLEKVDFVVVNGIEMQDWCAAFCENLFLYPITPTFPLRSRLHRDGASIVTAYHGNRVHIETMFPHVTTALETLAKERPVVLRLMYNIQELGQARLPWSGEGPVRVEHLDWSLEGYEKWVATADIGIMPMLIPIADEERAKRTIRTCPEVYREHPSDCLVRYKRTSNAGRLFVYAQFGVPVVADMCPSALQAVRDGETGFVAMGAAGWYRALKQLADSVELRRRMSQAMLADYMGRWTTDRLNRSFVEFLRSLPAEHTPPASVRGAEGQWKDPGRYRRMGMHRLSISAWWRRFF